MAAKKRPGRSESTIFERDKKILSSASVIQAKFVYHALKKEIESTFANHAQNPFDKSESMKKDKVPLVPHVRPDRSEPMFGSGLNNFYKKVYSPELCQLKSKPLDARAKCQSVQKLISYAERQNKKQEVEFSEVKDELQQLLTKSKKIIDSESRSHANKYEEIKEKLCSTFRN